MDSRPAPDALQSLFENSPDAIWLFDTERGVFVDCNRAAVALLRATDKAQLLNRSPLDFSPERQPEGWPSRDQLAAHFAAVESRGSARFEWLASRLDGEPVHLEVATTRVQQADRHLHFVVCRDVSHRRAAEQALSASQQLLSSITDHISDAVYRTAPDHSLTFANRAYLRLFGYPSLAEIQALPRECLYAQPADRRVLLQRLERDGHFRHIEVEFIRRDGSHFWGLMSSAAILDPAANRVLYHVGSISDITARKYAEDEVRRLNVTLERRVIERTAEAAASEARMRTLVEHAPEAIVVLDGESGRFVTCNENAVRLYGRSRETLMTLTPTGVSPPLQPDGRRSADAAAEWLRRALDGEAPVFEWLHQHAGGRLIPCEVRLVRLPSDGRPLVRGSVTDNTERQHRERIQRATFEISEAVLAVEDLEHLYERIHDSVRGLMAARNFYIALYDAAAGMISFPYFVDEHGHRPDPFPLGTGLTGYVLRTGRPLLMDRALGARKERRGDRVRFMDHPGLEYVESGPGAAIWLGVPLLVQGKAIGVMAVQDYTDPDAYREEEKRILTFVAGQVALAIDRKRAETEMLRALARERELSALKSGFVSMVSHEFRTPLAVILSSSEILDDYLDHLSPGERREQLQSIQKNARRMATLMEEVLFLGKVEAGKLEFRPEPHDLPALCRRLAGEVLSATQQRCPIDLEVGLPGGDSAVADERLLTPIFTNLLINAVKYSAAGQRVTWTVERDGGEMVSVVRDRGIGIPVADQPWLFHAFQRGRNVGDRPGTGLGLVIVKRCVELHGGRVSIASEPGAGTTVTVRLPVFPPPS